jgi:hypothetical protein
MQISQTSTESEELGRQIDEAWKRYPDYAPFRMPREIALLYDRLNKSRGYESKGWLREQLAAGYEVLRPSIPAFMGISDRMAPR